MRELLCMFIPLAMSSAVYYGGKHMYGIIDPNYQYYFAYATGAISLALIRYMIHILWKSI